MGATESCGEAVEEGTVATDPTPQPTPVPTLIGSMTAGPETTCTVMTLDVYSDGWGNEISVKLFDGTGHTLIDANEFPNDTITTMTESCIDMGQCSLLRIEDSYGDGLLNGGKIVLYLDDDIEYEGSDYGEGIEIRIGRTCPGTGEGRDDSASDSSLLP